MAVFTEPTQWSHTLGNNADVVTLPDDTGSSSGLASLQKLWQQVNQLPLAAGGVAPSRTDMNALFKLLGDSVFYGMQGGVASYNAGYDYPAGALVKYNNAFYLCIATNGPSGTVANPENSAYWLKMATEHFANLLMPAGTIIHHAGSSIPSGFLLCNGSAVSRTTYADLFTAIGTLYGAGDGSTTFNLPDARDRFLEGAGTNSVGSYLEAGLPNITGSSAYDNMNGTSIASVLTNYTGAFTYRGKSAGCIVQTSATTSNDKGWGYGLNIDASRLNNIYGNSSTVQPKSVNTNILIKY